MPQKCRLCDFISGLLETELISVPRGLRGMYKDYKLKIKTAKKLAFKTLTQMIGIQLGEHVFLGGKKIYKTLLDLGE